MILACFHAVATTLKHNNHTKDGSHKLFTIFQVFLSYMIAMLEEQNKI